MFNAFKTFKSDETGAVTVDWVVITAAIVLLATLVAVTVRDSTVDTADVMADAVATTKFKE